MPRFRFHGAPLPMARRRHTRDARVDEQSPDLTVTPANPMGSELVGTYEVGSGYNYYTMQTGGKFYVFRIPMARLDPGDDGSDEDALRRRQQPDRPSDAFTQQSNDGLLGSALQGVLNMATNDPNTVTDGADVAKQQQQRMPENPTHDSRFHSPPRLQDWNSAVADINARNRRAWAKPNAFKGQPDATAS